MTYQGHLPNGNPVQQHSAGEVYPFVIMQQGLEPDAKHFICYGNESYRVASDFKGTYQIAQRIKDTVAPCWYDDALENHSITFAMQNAAPEAALADQIDASDAPAEFEQAYNLLYEYVEAGCFLDQEVAGRMLKLSVHDNGMFLKDFRDDRFVHAVYPSMNTAGTVAQIMWRLFPNECTCNFADWRGVVGAWLLHCGEPILNWQNLAMDTWRSGAYLEVKSWQDLCALLNAITSKD
jgi:hypothetical protein|nr:MAG TPA: hypothetical protein [Caudoviricetes sp.]